MQSRLAKERDFFDNIPIYTSKPKNKPVFNPDMFNFLDNKDSDLDIDRIMERAKNMPVYNPDMFNCLDNASRSSGSAGSTFKLPDYMQLKKNYPNRIPDIPVTFKEPATLINMDDLNKTMHDYTRKMVMKDTPTIGFDTSLKHTGIDAYYDVSKDSIGINPLGIGTKKQPYSYLNDVVIPHELGHRKADQDFGFPVHKPLSIVHDTPTNWVQEYLADSVADKIPRFGIGMHTHLQTDGYDDIMKTLHTWKPKATELADPNTVNNLAYLRAQSERFNVPEVKTAVDFSLDTWTAKNKKLSWLPDQVEKATDTFRGMDFHFPNYTRTNLADNFVSRAEKEQDDNDVSVARKILRFFGVEGF